MSNAVFITKLDEFIKRIQLICEDGTNVKELLLEALYTQLATEANETIKSRTDLEVKALFNQSQYISPWYDRTKMAPTKCEFCEDISLMCVSLQSRVDDLTRENAELQHKLDEHADVM